MKISPVKLVSNNIHNLRHGIEDPIVTGVKTVTPEGYHKRPCFQVEYPSDKKVDYIPFVSVEKGDWKMRTAEG